jgi:hypothetical protein
VKILAGRHQQRRLAKGVKLLISDTKRRSGPAMHDWRAVITISHCARPFKDAGTCIIGAKYGHLWIEGSEA